MPITASDTRATIRVAIADDHAVVRRALRLLLESHDDIAICGEAADLRDSIDLARALHPDVAVCDLNMPGGTTLEAIGDITALGCAVVVLTMQADPAFARAALRAGAIAYVLKDAAPDELLAAVRNAAAGRAHLDPAIDTRPTASPASDSDSDGLTPREIEVLTLLALGHTNAELAAQLHVSCRTVETHRAHIQQKTGVQTRATLVRYALDRGLLTTWPRLAAARRPGGEQAATP